MKINSLPSDNRRRMSSINSVMSDGTEMSERPESPENLILTRKRGRKPFQFRIIQLTYIGY